MATADAASAQAWVKAAERHPLLTPAEEIHLGGMVRQWRDHPKGLAEDAENPDPEHRAVIRRGLRARDRMVAANLRLVASFVQRRQHDGPLVDRFQNATLGLITAAEKFDPTRGWKFSTYAWWWLRAEVGKGEFQEPAIKLPSNVFAAIRGQTNGNCSPESLAAGRAASFVRSLDFIVPGDSDDTALGDLIAAPAPIEPDPEADELQERMAGLDPIQQRLITGRWGLEGPPRNYAQLASQEAISIAEVKLILDQALRRLRRESPPPAPTLTPWRPEQCCQLSLGL
jgi:RNA polymerase primary sigma factor